MPDSQEISDQTSGTAFQPSAKERELQRRVLELETSLGDLLGRVHRLPAEYRDSVLSDDAKCRKCFGTGDGNPTADRYTLPDPGGCRQCEGTGRVPPLTFALASDEEQRR